MNAAILLMTSTVMVGADPAPTPPAPPPLPPVVVHGGAGCSGPGCGGPVGPVVSGGCCDACGSGKAGFFDRLKSRVGGFSLKRSKSADCCPAPTPCATCAPAPCDTCGAAPRPNLFDRLKGRFGKRKSYDCCASPCAEPCATPLPPGAHPVPPAPPEPPKEMPKTSPKKDEPKKTSSDTSLPSIPSPGAINVPPYPMPVTPVSGPKLNGTTSPY